MNLASFRYLFFKRKMSEQSNASIVREEQDAAKAAAEENVRELRKELEQAEDDSDDEVVAPTTNTKPSSAPVTNKSNANVKKEAPEMNIQLQR